MTNNLLRAGALSCALLASTCLTAPAVAQAPPPLPSVYQNVDGNGVDLTDGSFNFSIVEGSIGTGDGALTVARSYGRAGWTDGLPGRLNRTLSQSNNVVSVTFDNRVEFFDRVNGDWVPRKGDGATLTGSVNSYTYRSAGGTEVHYGAPGRTPAQISSGSGGTNYCLNDDAGECVLLPLSVVRPGGRRIDLHWTVARACGEANLTTGQACNWFPRLGSIANESAYLAKYIYAENGHMETAPPTDWFRRTGVQLVNLAVESCIETACSPEWPTIAYSQAAGGVSTVTDMGGRTWRFTETDLSFAIARPGDMNDDILVTRVKNGPVTSVTADGVATSYSHSAPGSTATMIVTNALQQQTVVVSDLTIGRPTSVTDALSRTTSFSHDAFGRLERVTAPLGNYVESRYDARGNVDRTVRVAAPGSGDPIIVTSATFAAVCTNVVTCNLPTSSTDARGNVTDYAYDPSHGGLLSVTAPAAAPGAVRPQVRYSYGQRTGTAGVPVQVLTATSACRTLASCAGTADEVRTTIDYSSTNLQPVTLTSGGSGNGALVATRTLGYDNIGNVITSDGPLDGTEDTVRFRYNAARQRVGTASPDPDGAGPLRHRAERITYRPDGQASRIETGTVDGQSDAHWAAMTVLDQAETSFDNHNRPEMTSLTSGGVVHARSETRYDALGRPDCVAQRMDPSDWGADAANACIQDPTPSAAFGPDRIVQTVRDAAGQVTQQRTAVGTSLDTAEISTAYTQNGQAATLIDGTGNRTLLRYDGHSRPSCTIYPATARPQGAPAYDDSTLATALATAATASGGTCGEGDRETVTYETRTVGTETRGSDVIVARRNRAGETTTFALDALGRTTLVNRPNNEDDLSFGHDLIGRIVSASLPGHALSFGHDALGRPVTQTGPSGTITSSYDLAGRRTRLTHPDGFFVEADHLVTGEVTRVRENGAVSGVGVLASYAYDDRGRRTGVTRGNGTVTSYGYDGASRLQQLTQNLAGTGHDQLLGFTYSPASQIVSSTRSNDVYASSPGATQTEVPNGLNQVAQVNGTAIGYDARGNLTSDGSRSFAYSSDNLLVWASGGVSLSYDPLLRLSSVRTGTAANQIRRFDYDGASMIAERDGAGTLARRFVHGPGIDEPLVQYEGAGTADRRFLHADERGSIVAHSDAAGAVSQVNRYDEYGVPASGNAGPFQYTGQIWLPEPQLYYYRARMYDPRLGRFLQADPIGYGDGMNMYAYVGGDPVNGADPSGAAMVPCNPDTRIRLCEEGSGHGSDHVKFGSSVGLPGFEGGFGGAVMCVRRCSMPGNTPSQPGIITVTAPPVFEFVRFEGVQRSLPDFAAWSNESYFHLASFNHRLYGPVFGHSVSGRRRGVLLTDRSGGFVEAAEDLDHIARLNNIPPLGMKGLISAPPAGWIMRGGRNEGWIAQHVASRLQLRVTGGRAHIDIPMGMRIGTSVFDTSLHGEVVHYND